MRKQLFILDRDMLDAMSDAEVEATYKDMEEMGIANPPFDAFTIQLPCGRVFGLRFDDGTRMRLDDYNNTRELKLHHTDKNAAFRIHYEKKGEQWYSKFEIEDQSHRFRDYLEALRILKLPDAEWKDLQADGAMMAACYKMFLVVALGTRNVERVVKENRLARFGIGKRERGADFQYVTTIKMGNLVQYEGESVATGETRRPHLRRGHIRNQHYGPKNQYVKRVWIEPIFVNGYVPSEDHRHHYNVVKEKAK